MDRNSILGIILIIAVFVGFTFWQNHQNEEWKKQHPKEVKEWEEKVAKTSEKVPESDSLRSDSLSQKPVVHLNDSARKKMAENEYGMFAIAAQDSNKFYTIENNLLKLKISTKGGRPYSVELKKFDRYDSTKVVLFNGDSTEFGLILPHRTKNISTNGLFFKPVKDIANCIVDKKADSIAFRLYVADTSYIEYVYALKPNDYMVNFHMNFVKMGEVIDQTAMHLNWEMNIPRQEKGRANEDQYTNLQYMDAQGDDKSMSAAKPDSANVPSKLKWIAYKQQFFLSVLISDSALLSADLKSVKLPETTNYLKHYSAYITMDFENKPLYSANMKFYFGPNQYNTLKKYDLGLENTVFIGRNIVKGINKFVILPIFNFLNKFIFNYGIIILLLTIIIKLALFPLTFKSYQSQAKMRVLKPQIDEINAKIPKEKAMERQQATMALYRKVGVNPLGGCLPMLLQFPILIAMFRMFPTSIELRHQGFLWATDLSTYDSIFSWSVNIPILSSIYGNHISLFTLLMTASTIISMKMSQSTSTDYSAMPGMKTLMYIMPIMFMFILNKFSAGLTYYYFLANVITILQNEIFKRMIDEKKLLAQLHAHKAKPAKKSKFQERMEQMAKQRGYKLPK